MYDIIFDVISAWQVIAVGLLIMIVLPIIFYFASFDKNPVKIKRIPDKKKSMTKDNTPKRGNKPIESDEKNTDEQLEETHDTVRKTKGRKK